MKRIDTVVFDLDGTLLDTLEDLKDAVVYLQEKYGYPVHTLDQVRRHVGNGIPFLIAKSIPGGEDNPDYRAFLDEYKAYYQIHCNDKTRPYPGIPAMMAELEKRGYHMAIVSNKADSAVKELNRIYFSEYIRVAIGGNEEAGVRRKPAPDTVFTALDQLGVSGDRAIYVGDSEVDILTAANSGLDCILCEWGFRQKEDLIRQGGRYFVSTAGEIPDMLDKFNADKEKNQE